MQLNYIKVSRPLAQRASSSSSRRVDWESLVTVCNGNAFVLVPKIIVLAIVVVLVMVIVILTLAIYPYDNPYCFGYNIRTYSLPGPCSVRFLVITLSYILYLPTHPLM